MGKIVLFFGLVVGAAIFVVALIGAPAGSEVAAHEVQPAAGCHVEQFALDEGYGVSRQIVRHVCPGME